MKKWKLLALCIALLQILLLLAACGGEANVTTGTTTKKPTVGTTAGTTATPTVENPSSEPVTEPTTEPPVTVPPITEPGTTVPPVTEPGTTVPPVTEPGTTVPPVTEPGTTVPPVTTEPPIQPPVFEEDEDYLTLVTADGEVRCGFLYPENATGAMQRPVDEMNDKIAEWTGAKLFYDFQDELCGTYDVEIVLLGTRGESEAERLLEQLDDRAYCIAVIDHRIYLLSNNSANVSLMVEDLTQLLEMRNGALVVSRDALVSSLIIPEFVTEAGTIIGDDTYYTTETVFQTSYAGVTYNEVQNYRRSLVEVGYELYDENTFGQVRFFSYRSGRDLIIVQYNDVEKFVRIGYSHNEYIPDPEPQVFEKLADASIANLFRHERSGLGLVIQLGDGTYVILDGGYMGGPLGNAAGDADRDSLYQYLVDNKPAEHEKPIISAWLLTHAHGDHDDAITAFLMEYGPEVELKMFAHHFPNFTRYPCVGEPEGQAENYYGGVTLQMVREFCPDATEWYARTGQRLMLADAEIEIMYTCEDLYPIQPRGINDTNTTYRITIDGVSAMLLGDSDSYANDQMALYYGEELRSDILQLAHHSYNGEPMQYQLIDPKVCFWANFDYAITSGRPCNQYLLQTRWKRTDADGVTSEENRTHYYNNQDCRVYFKDLK